MKPFIYIPPSPINPNRKDVSYNLVDDMQHLVQYYTWDRIYKLDMKDYLLSLQMQIENLLDLYKINKPHIIHNKRPQYFIRVTNYSTPDFIVMLKTDEEGSWGWNERIDRFYSNPDAVKAEEEFVWID